MSHTFISNPARTISRGRGANRGGTRGSSTAARLPQVGVDARTIARPTGSQLHANSSTSTAQNRQVPQLGQPGAGRATTSGLNSRTSNTRTGARGRGTMDYSQNQNCGGPQTNANAGPGLPNQEGQNGEGREAQGGYTVIPRNEKKHRQISQQAQKETANYERFKEAQKGKTYRYVGTCGGGEISEDQARARQAHQVRAAKFNRQMKQAEQREATKKAEEDAIEAKRAEARRKAELNAQRQARAPPAAEVRRNREAFLAQFDMNRAPQPTSTTSPVSNSPPEVRGNLITNNTTLTSTCTQASPRRNGNSSTNQMSPQNPNGTGVPHNGNRLQGEGTNPRVFQNRESTFGAVSRAGRGVKTEVKREREAEVETSQVDEEIQILVSMYPDMPVDYIADLLHQMGSIDGVMAALDIN